MDQYFSRAQQVDLDGKRQTVDQWLQELRKKVNPNAYNIIVSPLHKSDAPFAKAVIDQVFEHSLRFLHMDLDAVFREDVRAKFSYIADEYRKIRQFDRNKPVNVYFVNTAITSGNTLARARNLVTMLMEESGVEYDRGSIFKGCFVLVNRSAFDTLNAYVKEPTEHFWAYLHLAVPSFNSRRDRCPTCELLEKYRILEYSSAGNHLGHEFRRLRVKHAKRTMAEYQRWLGETVINSHGYAGWLRQWLYSYVKAPRRKEGKLRVGIFEVDDAQYADLKALYDLLQWGVDKYLIDLGMGNGQREHEEDYLDAINRFSLTHFQAIVEANYAEAKVIIKDHDCCLRPEYWKRVLVDHVCAQKNYLRLAAIHRAFLKMDTTAELLKGELVPREQQTAKLLAEFMRQELQKVGTRQLKAEWLISYLKVLSRPHLAQYHHIRQGILTLMLQMTAYAIGSSQSLPSDLSFAEPFLGVQKDSMGELIRCQVLQTLLKRLAGLQSTYFLYEENMEKVINTFSQLRTNFLSRTDKGGRAYQYFNPIPTWEQVERNLIKLVKWTSSCGDDENGCYLIDESFLGKEGAK